MIKVIKCNFLYLHTDRQKQQPGLTMGKPEGTVNIIRLVLSVQQKIICCTHNFCCRKFAAVYRKIATFFFAYFLACHAAETDEEERIRPVMWPIRTAA